MSSKKRRHEPDLPETAGILTRQFYEACYLSGIYEFTDNDCCCVLAWVYVYGGGHEAVIYNERLCGAILAAQKRLNIFGSEKPNAELAFKMVEYIKSITDFDSPPKWVVELEQKFNIKPYRRSKK
jgi:hypothetical protein